MPERKRFFFNWPLPLDQKIKKMTKHNQSKFLLNVKWPSPCAPLLPTLICSFLCRFCFRGPVGRWVLLNVARPKYQANHNLYHCDRFPVNCRIIFHRHHAVNAFKPAQKFTYCSGIHQEKHKWNRKIQLDKTNCFYGHLSIGITLSSSKNHHLHLCTLNKYMRTNSLFSTMPSSLPGQVLFPEDSPQWLLRPT